MGECSKDCTLDVKCLHLLVAPRRRNSTRHYFGLKSFRARMYGEEDEEVDYGALSEDDVISLGDTTQFVDNAQNPIDGFQPLAGSTAAQTNARTSTPGAARPASRPVVEAPLQISGSPSQLKVPLGLPPKPSGSVSMSPSTSMSRRDLPEVREVRREREAPRTDTRSDKQDRPARDLPVGWLEKVSSKGRTYYYCPATDKSTWERPTASPPKIEPVNVPTSGSQADDRERSIRLDRDLRLPPRDETRSSATRMSDRYDAVRPARSISPPPRRLRSRSPVMIRPRSRSPPLRRPRSRSPLPRLPPVDSRVGYPDRIRSRPPSRSRSPPLRRARPLSPGRRSSLKHDLDRDLDRYNSRYDPAAPVAPRRSRLLMSLSNTKRLIHLSSSIAFTAAQITCTSLRSLKIAAQTYKRSHATSKCKISFSSDSQRSWHSA